MNFNVRKCCVPLYDEEEDWEGEHDEDENGNIQVRKAIEVQIIEALDQELIPVHKRGQI